MHTCHPFMYFLLPLFPVPFHEHSTFLLPFSLCINNIIILRILPVQSSSYVLFTYYYELLTYTFPLVFIYVNTVYTMREWDSIPGPTDRK